MRKFHFVRFFHSSTEIEEEGEVSPSSTSSISTTTTSTAIKTEAKNISSSNTKKLQSEQDGGHPSIGTMESSPGSPVEPIESDHESTPNRSPEDTLNSTSTTSGKLKSKDKTPPPQSPLALPSGLSLPPPPPPPPPPVSHHFCISCGIKFTSLDTLHAHQTFYCMKRKDVLVNGGVEGSDLNGLPKCSRIMETKNFSSESEAEQVKGEHFGMRRRRRGDYYRSRDVNHCFSDTTANIINSPSLSNTNNNTIRDKTASSSPSSLTIGSPDNHISHKSSANNSFARKSPSSSPPFHLPTSLPASLAMNLGGNGHPLQILGFTGSPSSSPTRHGSGSHLTLLSPSTLLNQPIFVAISTNPLILVPCSYNASTGGLSIVSGASAITSSSGISSSSNLMGQPISQNRKSPSSIVAGVVDSPPPRMRTLSSSRRQRGNIQKGIQRPSNPPAVVIDEDASHDEEDLDEEEAEDLPLDNGGPLDLSSKVEDKQPAIGQLSCDEESGHGQIPFRTQRRRQSSTIIIAPGSCCGQTSGSPFIGGKATLPGHHHHHHHHHHPDIHDASTDDNASRSSCCSPPPSLNHLTSLQGLGHAIPAGLLADHGAVVPGTSASSIVKHGTYRCEDCDIVFYKQENFLVHKSLYCASRRSQSVPSTKGIHSSIQNGLHHDHHPHHHGLASSPSPEPPESDHAPNSSPEVTMDTIIKRDHVSLGKTGKDSPGRSVTSTPPIASPPPPPPLLPPGLPVSVPPHFCASCGIKFTSLDTLHAHQAFYCLKRNSLLVANGGPPIAGSEAVNGTSAQNDIKKEDAVPSHPSTNGQNPSSNSSTTASKSHPPNTHHHHSSNHHHNLQSYKCTICGYKGHTMRGMRTHVRIHADKMGGLSEEAFIECLDDHPPEADKLARLAAASRGRRRSHDPVSDGSSVKRRRQGLSPIPSSQLRT